MKQDYVTLSMWNYHLYLLFITFSYVRFFDNVYWRFFCFGLFIYPIILMLKYWGVCLSDFILGKIEQAEKHLKKERSAYKRKLTIMRNRKMTLQNQLEV